MLCNILLTAEGLKGTNHNVQKELLGEHPWLEPSTSITTRTQRPVLGAFGHVGSTTGICNAPGKAGIILLLSVNVLRVSQSTDPRRTPMSREPSGQRRNAAPSCSTCQEHRDSKPAGKQLSAELGAREKQIYRDKTFLIFYGHIIQRCLDSRLGLAHVSPPTPIVPVATDKST